ncbi:MAG: signal peptidase I [Oligoflexia bacterium]|nr:signal peptidase I [Oligoflexia bacterium]
MTEQKPPSEKGLIREYVESLFVAIIIALILRSFVIAAYKIPTGSMAPTLKAGDCIFAWKLPYGLRIPFTRISIIQPQIPDRGDVIVFRYPEDESLSFIKRVVGVPGDKIEIRQKRLYINDKISQYENLKPADLKVFDDLPHNEFHIFQKETIDNKSHLVMFRRGEDEDSYGPEVVPEDRLFVLGDNRDSSDDSRFWGMVPLKNLEGRAILIWCSFDWEKRIKNTGIPRVRTERLLTVIH